MPTEPEWKLGTPVQLGQREGQGIAMTALFGTESIYLRRPLYRYLYSMGYALCGIFFCEK